MATSVVFVGTSIASFYGNGGTAWTRLSWILGLRRLGFEVMVVEQLDRARCVHAAEGATGYEGCLNVPYFERIVNDFGLQDSAVLVGQNREQLYGPAYEELLDLAGDAQGLVNLGGDLMLNEVKRRFGLKIYVDLDPGLTHLWLAAGKTLPRVAGHDLHFTYGENIDAPGSKLPSGGISWLTTRDPLLLDEWPVVDTDRRDRFTTVGRWRGFGPHGPLEGMSIEVAQKAGEFMKVLDLPSRAPGIFELALKLGPGEEEEMPLLERHGWRVIDAATVSADPHIFRRYVQGSGAEFSVARKAYVDTWSAHFSDRTTRYLGSGKPTLVQDAGFSRIFPVGEGLIAFNTLEEAIAGAKSIAEDYERHSRAARAIAEEYFDSDKVCARFAEDAGLAP